MLSVHQLGNVERRRLYVSTNVARRLTEGSKVVVDLAFTIVSVRARGLRLVSRLLISHTSQRRRLLTSDAGFTEAALAPIKEGNMIT